MEDKAKLLDGYHEDGLASVLIGAANLVERAADRLRECRTSRAPPAVAKAYRKEVALCLAEAEELIVAVRGKLVQ